MSVLRIETGRASGRTVVVMLQGPLDMTTDQDLTAAVHAALGQGPRRLVLDCRECSFVDSTGLAALVAAMRAARHVGAIVRLARVDERLRLLLERTNLFRLLREVALPEPCAWDDPESELDAGLGIPGHRP